MVAEESLQEWGTVKIRDYVGSAWSVGKLLSWDSRHESSSEWWVINRIIIFTIISIITCKPMMLVSTWFNIRNLQSEVVRKWWAREIVFHKRQEVLDKNRHDWGNRVSAWIVCFTTWNRNWKEVSHNCGWSDFTISCIFSPRMLTFTRSCSSNYTWTLSKCMLAAMNAELSVFSLGNNCVFSLLSYLKLAVSLELNIWLSEFTTPTIGQLSCCCNDQ